MHRILSVLERGGKREHDEEYKNIIESATAKRVKIRPFKSSAAGSVTSQIKADHIPHGPRGSEPQYHPFRCSILPCCNQEVLTDPMAILKSIEASVVTDGKPLTVNQSFRSA